MAVGRRQLTVGGGGAQTITTGTALKRDGLASGDLAFGSNIARRVMHEALW